ncbi:acyl-CoA dehydrogenase family protein [Streptomyces sp. NPDC051219]|uniref:acyl-CoA dehydrogenase family protein n=1 Tax=Streptomyces sp. NPDC051219 TaxID=3155283 RepID=UPI00342FDD4E
MSKASAADPASARAGQPADEAMWRRITRELADDLASDAIARERAGKSPFDEVSRLREAGLLELLTPAGPAGPGADWATACAVIREIAAADSSIGELLARHYALTWSARFFGSADHASSGAARHKSRPAEEHWLLGGSTDLPGAGPGAGLTLTPTGEGYVLNGRRVFAAGVSVADRLVLGASCTRTGDPLLVLVDPDSPGVLIDALSERLGQRLSGAGSVGFDGTRVGPDQILGTLPHDEHTVSPFTALAPQALRLALTHVSLGIAEGALAEARDISRTNPHARPATAAGDDPYADRPSGDPYLLLAYGELATAVRTAAALVEHATTALAGAVLAGPELGVDEQADAAILVAAAETVADNTAVDLTMRILQLTSHTRPLDDSTGLDRFWRNARVLTAGNSPTHRLRDIGDHFLNGAHPPFAPGA